MKSLSGLMEEKLRFKFRRRYAFYVVLLLLAGVIFGGALLVLRFERATNPEIKTYGDALWLQFVTMATVGYGDKVPITSGGKITCVTSMLFGVGLLSAFITTLAAGSVEKAKRRMSGLDEKTSLKDHVLICGWNARGPHVVRFLTGDTARERVPVVLLCKLPESPVEEELLFFYQGNPVSRADLERVNAGGARSVVLLADESAGGSEEDVDARTVLSAFTVMSLNPHSHISAEVLITENRKHLELAGVGEVLDGNSVSGNLLGRSALNYGLIGLVSTIASKDAGSRAQWYPAPDGAVGAKYSDAVNTLEKEGYSVLAMRSRGHEMRMGKPDSIIQEGDEFLVITSTDRESD